MQKIGWIGVGIMGKAMVRNLMKAGYQLHIYARHPEKVADVVSEGAVFHDSIADCVKASDVVITMVGFPKDVEEVYFTPGAILDNAAKDTLLIDMTTTSPTLAKRISEEGAQRGLRVLDAVSEKFGHTFTYTKVLMGGEAIDAYGDPLPQSELDKCLQSDSVLLGAIGGPKWEGLPGDKRAEKGLLRLRAGMGLYSNNRPAKIWPQLADASPLKPAIVEKGIDFIVVRELIGGVYFGEHRTYEENGEKVAVDTMPYSEHEIERIGRIGFETARKRRKKLCCVDKANVLDTSRLWREVMHRLAAECPDVEYREMFVDNCAMQICKDPAQFDVIVTENMFGDILSDEASEITGSIGMVPSSSLGDGTRGLYEPIHGSAPDIAGQDIINPIACILSAAMMLRYSFDMAAEADCIEAAVNQVLNDGIRTADIWRPGCEKVGCAAMGDAILARL